MKRMGEADRRSGQVPLREGGVRVGEIKEGCLFFNGVCVCPLSCPPARCKCFLSPEQSTSSPARLGEGQGFLCILPRTPAPSAAGLVPIPRIPLCTCSSTFWGPKHFSTLCSCFLRLDLTHRALHCALLPADAWRGWATGLRGPCKKSPTLFPKHQIMPEAFDTIALNISSSLHRGREPPQSPMTPQPNIPRAGTFPHLSNHFPAQAR